MLVSKAIERVRAAMHDVTEEYDDEECLLALNTAAHEIAALLIAGRAPILAKEEEFVNGAQLPEGFFKTAGTYPVKITGDTMTFLDDKESMVIRYFAMPAEMTLDDDSCLPFRHSLLNSLVLKVAEKMLLNENEFDITQDTAIQQEIMQAIQQGWAG
jgi:hypothetical protein